MDDGSRVSVQDLEWRWMDAIWVLVMVFRIFGDLDWIGIGSMCISESHRLNSIGVELDVHL